MTTESAARLVLEEIVEAVPAMLHVEVDHDDFGRNRPRDISAPPAPAPRTDQRLVGCGGVYATADQRVPVCPNREDAHSRRRVGQRPIGGLVRPRRTKEMN